MSQRLLSELKSDDGKIARLYGSEEGDQEIFVEGIHGLMTSQAFVKLNFFTVAMTSDKHEERREVACRLVIPLPVFFSIAEFLSSRANQLKEQVALSPVQLEELIAEQKLISDKKVTQISKKNKTQKSKKKKR